MIEEDNRLHRLSQMAILLSMDLKRIGASLMFRQNELVFRQKESSIKLLWIIVMRQVL